MPPRQFKESKRSLRQTTLFATPPLRKQSARSPEHYSGPPLTSTVKGKVKRARVSSSPDDSDIGAIHFAPTAESIISSSSGDNDAATTPSKFKHKRKLTRFVSKSSSEEENTPSKPRMLSTSNLVDSEVEDTTPRKRPRLRRRWSEEGKALDEQQHLSDEVDEEYILDERLRARNKKSTYQKNLEKLKRRKLKISDSQEDDTGEENDLESTRPSDEDESSKPFKGSKLSNLADAENHSDGESNSSNSSGFIVEDDNIFQLPSHFSMETHQDISHQFKKVFQFFVHVAVQASGCRESFMKGKLANEEYFSVPLQVMRRKLLGIRDSLVSSSVWKPQFRRSLEKYPEVSLVPLAFAVPNCDACHLGSRMSTRICRLTGSEYNVFGFDSVKSDSEDGDDEKLEYHLGRFCAKRTRVYHEFSHWEYALFQCISKEIDELRSSSSGRGFQRVAYFGGMEPPDDLSDADALCDWLDQRRIIDMEWQKLKAMMERAHHLEIRNKGGEVDD